MKNDTATEEKGLQQTLCQTGSDGGASLTLSTPNHECERSENSALPPTAARFTSLFDNGVRLANTPPALQRRPAQPRLVYPVHLPL
jgi:hypothetical protein